MTENNNPPSFEAAYKRLEEILQKMNSGTVSLDNSLSLYEEADKLIKICNKRLENAERKIEVLIKNREGELETNEAGDPVTASFDPSNGSGF